MASIKTLLKAYEAQLSERVVDAAFWVGEFDSRSNWESDPIKKQEHQAARDRAERRAKRLIRMQERVSELNS